MAPFGEINSGYDCRVLAGCCQSIPLASRPVEPLQLRWRSCLWAMPEVGNELPTMGSPIAGHGQLRWQRWSVSLAKVGK